jgi:hypothetical protein
MKMILAADALGLKRQMISDGFKFVFGQAYGA